MNNDIKEILDSIKYHIDEDDWFEIEGHFLKPLLDYITNLQEEKERLHTRIKTIKRRRKAQTAKMRKYREEITNKQNSIVDYKSRNEKAIEYMNAWLDGFNNEDIIILLNNLGNILQGSDKDE